MAQPSSSGSDKDYAAFWATISTIQETAEMLGRLARELDAGALAFETTQEVYDVVLLEQLLFKGLQLTAQALDMLTAAPPGTAAQQLADSKYWQILGHDSDPNA